METSMSCPSCSNEDTLYKPEIGQYVCKKCFNVFSPIKVIEPQTIFLSYAHKSEREEDFDISEDLVWLIKEGLEGDGHHVWIDHEGIRGGAFWRERITDAITSHKHFLAFLSKRSVRQDPNVCLNEVAIAIKHNRIIQTILTESENRISAPLTLSSIQWHKFQDWKEIKEGKKQGPKGEDWEAWFGSVMSEIRENLVNITHQQKVGELGDLFQILTPSSFTSDIIQSVEGFFGRKWLFEAYRKWLPTDKRLFWVKGSPGIGKSSFAAKLVHDGNSEVVGFFKCNFQSHKSAEDSATECIRTLAYQLASRLPDYRIKLLRGQMVDRETVQKKTADDLFTYLITEPLNRSEKIAESHRLVLVVDALDEAGRKVSGVDANPLADLIYKHAEKLPSWLGVVITSRPEAYLQQQLGPKFAPTVLDGGTEQNIQDIKDYLETKLDTSIEEPERKRIIDAIVNKSSGTFQYIKRLELSDEYDLTQPEKLPSSIDDLFLKDFQRYFPDISLYEERTEKFLRLMVAAPGPLPKQLGQEVLKWEERDVTKNLTQPMASMLTETADGLQLYHKSLGEWLSDGSKSGNYQINSNGAKVLGDFLWKEFKDSNLNTNLKASTFPKNHFSQIGDLKWKSKILGWLPSLINATDCWNSIEDINKISEYYRVNLRYASVLKLKERNVVLAENYRDKPNIMANALNELGLIFLTLGKLDEAINSLSASLEIFNNILGEAHLETSRVARNLGEAYYVKAEFNKAEELYLHSLEIHKRYLPDDHPDIGEILNNIGSVYDSKADYSTARKYYEEAYSILELKLGPDHPDSTDILANIGGVFVVESNYGKALPLFQKILNSSERVNGGVHPKTALYLTFVAGVHENKCQYSLSEPLYRRALDIQENILGPDHHDTAKTLTYLSWGMNANAKYSEARFLINRAIAIEEKNMGIDHPLTSRAYSYLADLLANIFDFKNAESLYRKILEDRKISLGDNHPDVGRTMANLGWLLCELENYEESKHYLENSLKILEKSLSFNHIHCGYTMNYLAHFFIHKSGDLLNSKIFIKKSLEINSTVLGNNHPYTADAMALYSDLLFREGNFSEAKSMMKKVLSIRKEVFGLYHPHVAVALNSIKWVLKAENLTDELITLENDLADNYAEFPELSIFIKHKQSNLKCPSSNIMRQMI